MLFVNLCSSIGVNDLGVAVSRCSRGRWKFSAARLLLNFSSNFNLNSFDGLAHISETFLSLVLFVFCG